MRVIYGKTARLFEVAAQSVAIVAGAENQLKPHFKNMVAISVPHSN